MDSKQHAGPKDSLLNPTEESEFDMTKGIRDFVNEKFAELLPQRTELGNTAFRKAVMQAAVMQYGISVASAATHYNYSLKFVREADATLVEGLGRPDGKKGGRKPIHLVDVVKAKSGEVVAEGLSRGAAELLITKAAGAGKAKLAIREREVAPEAATEVAAVEMAPVAETATA